ncbi:MAG: ABC transporter permease [Actinomycetota bacterium]|nr:ABC transporter permease [Actinomycetota bacterium]
MNTRTLPRPKAQARKPQLPRTPFSGAPLLKARLTRTLLPETAPRAAFGQIVRNEARLTWRAPAGLIFGVGLPMLLLVIFDLIPSFHQTQASLGGLTPFDVYVPILISMVIAIIALISLPGPLVAYRDQGILRRLSTTPVPPSWVLAAQLVIQFCIAAVSLLILIVVSITAFGLAVPKNPGALVLAVVLSIAALFAIGLCIAAAARSGVAARAIGAAAFYPMLFFSGMWFPRELMPGVLVDVSNFTPLGAAVEAIQDSMQGQFPPAESLLVLAGYALVFALIAGRCFRWE